MKLLLLGVKPWREDWDEATHSYKKERGTIYSVVKLKSKGPAVLDVKVAAPPIVEDEVIRANYKAGVVMWVELEDLDEDSFLIEGKLRRVSTATSVKLVPDSDTLDFGQESDIL